jgi:hypothetical protein
MPNTLISIFLIVSIVLVFSPIFRRKLWRMADDDLKRIDYDEWKKQMRSNAYIKLVSRIIWGLFILSGFILNFQEVVALGFDWMTVFVLVLGISFIVWGILGFRREIRKVNEII